MLSSGFHFAGRHRARSAVLGSLLLGIALVVLRGEAPVPGRHPEIEQSIAGMEKARLELVKLAQGTRWAEDYELRYLLFIQHYEKARGYAQAYREAHQSFLKIPVVHFLDDALAVRQWKRLTDWGAHTAIVQYEPYLYREPYRRIEKVLVPGP